jgi:hypothetical protein
MTFPGDVIGSIAFVLCVRHSDVEVEAISDVTMMK